MALARDRGFLGAVKGFDIKMPALKGNLRDVRFSGCILVMM